jgi:hypothetical protein
VDQHPGDGLRHTILISGDTSPTSETIKACNVNDVLNQKLQTIASCSRFGLIWSEHIGKQYVRRFSHLATVEGHGHGGYDRLLG